MSLENTKKVFDFDQVLLITIDKLLLINFRFCIIQLHIFPKYTIFNVINDKCVRAIAFLRIIYCKIPLCCTILRYWTQILSSTIREIKLKLHNIKKIEKPWNSRKGKLKEYWKIEIVSYFQQKYHSF